MIAETKTGEGGGNSFDPQRQYICKTLCDDNASKR